MASARALSLLKIGGPQVLRFFLRRDRVRRSCRTSRRHADGDRIRPAPALRRARRIGHADGRSRDRPRFAPLFEQAGVAGASSVAIAVAIGGIVFGGLVGGPGQYRSWSSARTSRRRDARRGGTGGFELVGGRSRRTPVTASNEDDDAWPIVKNLVAILVAMWIGFWVSKGFCRARHDAARLHRRDAGRGSHPQHRRRNRLVQASSHRFINTLLGSCR